MKKNKILLDIGTHQAQEIRVLSGDRLFIIYQYFSWLNSFVKRLIKILFFIKKDFSYGKGKFMHSPISFSIRDHLKIISLCLLKRNYLKFYKIISIDPASHITSKYLKGTENKIIYFPISISNNPSRSVSLIPFYIGKNELSSSIYKIDDKFKELSYCINFTPEFFIDSLLEKNLIKKDDEIILRINSEGTENDIINYLLKKDLNLFLIIGSIEDVKKIHGQNAYDSLNENLKKKGVNLLYFKGTDPSSWNIVNELLS